MQQQPIYLLVAMSLIVGCGMSEEDFNSSFVEKYCELLACDEESFEAAFTDVDCDTYMVGVMEEVKSLGYAECSFNSKGAADCLDSLNELTCEADDIDICTNDMIYDCAD